MKVSAVTLLLLDAFQYAHGFSLDVKKGPVQIKDWNGQVLEPPSEGGRRYGPNWTIDPETLGAKEIDQKCGAMVWAMDKDSAFQHPELRSDLPVGEWLLKRPNLGICMSGGGLRAATCALGWYRALHHLDLLTKARYVGANSGATWTTLPLFTRQMLEKKDDNVDMNYTRFVGEYLEPDKLDLENKETYGTIGKVLQKSNILDYQKDKDKVSFTDWTKAIDREYVEPVINDWKEGYNFANDFWLDLSNACLWNTKEKKYILNENSFPYPIFCATACDVMNDDQYFPIENTPLYSGIPIDPRILGVGEEFGGGFVQCVALNSDGPEDSNPVSPDPENLNFKEFDLPSPVVKVSELTGASSNALGAANAQTNIDLTNPLVRGTIRFFLPAIGKLMGLGLSGGRDIVNYLDSGKYKWWSPTTGGNPIDLAFLDGGLYDNLGVLAILRRGCSTVILCDASDTDLLKAKDSDIPSKFYDVGYLFGEGGFIVPSFLAKKSYSDTINKRSKVFEKKEFMILINEMRALQDKGKPLVVRKTLKLIPNPYAGIYESRDVDMIFCFNGKVREFDDRVPKPQNENSVGKKYPYFGTEDSNYSVGDVNKLSSLSSYSLVEGLKNVNFDISQVEN